MAIRWIDRSQFTGNFDGWTVSGTPVIDTTVKLGNHGYGAMKFVNTGGISATTSDVALADAGTRLSFHFRPTYAGNGGGIVGGYLGATAKWFLYSNGTGTVSITDASLTVLKTTSTAVIFSGCTYRFAVSYVITSTSSYTMKVWLDGRLILTATGADGNIGTGATLLYIGYSDTASLPNWFQHMYTDNGTDFADPCPTGLIRFTTAKFPTGNGSNNGYTTHGSASGTGTGHAPYINQRPKSTSADFLDQVSAGSLDEDYTLQSASAGDDDLTGAAIVGWMSFQYARLTGSGSSPVMSIFDNGVVTTFTPALAFALVTHFTLSTTYPATAPICGQRSTKGNAKVPAMDLCGMMIVYDVNPCAAWLNRPISQPVMATVPQVVM